MYLFEDNGDFKYLNITTVTDMNSMFYGCRALEIIKISFLNTSSLEIMNSMFYGSTAVKTIEISKLNTSSVTTMNSMFYGCRALEAGDRYLIFRYLISKRYEWYV